MAQQVYVDRHTIRRGAVNGERSVLLEGDRKRLGALTGFLKTSMAFGKKHDHDKSQRRGKRRIVCQYGWVPYEYVVH
mgnify:CR=1 FL=1